MKTRGSLKNLGSEVPFDGPEAGRDPGYVSGNSENLTKIIEKVTVMEREFDGN